MSRSLSQQKFDCQAYLQSLCKRSSLPLEIDFLQVERELTLLQQMQQSSCEQIVQFVDEHRQDFLKVAKSFNDLSALLSRSEAVLRALTTRIQHYKTKCYGEEAKVQQILNCYESALIKAKLIEMAKEEGTFLLNFNVQLESFVSKDVSEMGFTQKYLLSRFCRKFNFINKLFAHPLLLQFVPVNLHVQQLIVHLGDQVQLYISQQVAKVVKVWIRSNKHRQAATQKLTLIQQSCLVFNEQQQFSKQQLDNISINESTNKITSNSSIDSKSNQKEMNKNKSDESIKTYSNEDIEEDPLLELNDIKMWYILLGKANRFYELIQQNVIWKQLQSAQKILVSNKVILLPGKDSGLLQTFFHKILSATRHFPRTYPVRRIIELITNFLKKEELKFLYTYAMPIFPIAYRHYIGALNAAEMKETPQVWQQLLEKHNWNLKMWVTVREKNILERSAQDDDLAKWVEIIFKPVCLFPSVICDWLRVCLRLTNKYCARVAAAQYSPTLVQSIGDNFDSIPQLILAKVKDVVEYDIAPILQNIRDELQQALLTLTQKQCQIIADACTASIQSVSIFVTQCIRPKQQKPSQDDNIHQIFLPLNAFFKNNPLFTSSVQHFIRNRVQTLVANYYHSIYTKEVQSYAQENLTSAQCDKINKVLQQQKTKYFDFKQ